MEQKIYPYQYNNIKEKVFYLLNTYHSINDMNTIKAIQSETMFAINQYFNDTDNEFDEHIKSLMDVKLSKNQCEKILDYLKQYVIPFDIPSHKQIEKVFRKVKKLKMPEISDTQSRDSTFISWNDISSNRKYIIYYDENGQLQGFYGDLSPQTVKGFCNICNKESDVSLFLNRKKSGSDGRYIKKGDYICHDSVKCNQQLSDITYFHEFLQKLV